MCKKTLCVLPRVLALALAVCLLAACGREERLPDTDTLTFTDALGRAVTVEKAPQRVAALLGSFADIWTLSGGALCAAPEDAWEDYGLVLPEALHIGGAHSPNLEWLLSSDPGFVLASASTASHVELLETLEAAGIPVAYFDVDNFSDYLAMLDICTDLTGRKDLYEKNGLALERQIGTVKSALSESTLSEQERTVLLLRAHSGAVKAKGSQGTVLGEMLADLGCINIADSDSSLLENLSVESVIRREPYRIFVVAMGDDTDRAIENLYRMLEENPAWGTLDAVTEGRLHIMDRKLFHSKPNADWAESYEILSKIILEE